MAKRARISIIGPGKVGTAIGVLAARKGYRVTVGGRSAKRTAAAARMIGRKASAAGVDEAAAVGDIVLLTVSDGAIADVCDALSREGALTHGAIVAHCCGALGSEVLSSARELCGCRIASMHPLQTFPTAGAAVAAMKDAYFFLEGDAPALAGLEKLVLDIGAQARRLGQSPRHKALYHAAACMASNYLVALMDAMLSVAQEAGLERREAWVAMAPLIEATLNNITTLGPVKALTGPIARGDAATVQRHLDALKTLKDIEPLYRQLGLATTDLAERKGSITAKDVRRLRRLLRSRVPCL